MLPGRQPRSTFRKIAGRLFAATLFLTPTVADAAQVTRRPFGQAADGTPVEAITLEAGGVSVTIITLGASVQSILVPDRRGRIADVVLGFDDAAGYVANPRLFGATVGRVANRIGKGRFVLDGQTVQLVKNSGPNTLHGGAVGFDKAVWAVVSTHADRSARVVLRHISPHGDQGFPGTLTTAATFALDEAGTLSVQYEGTTDCPTVVALTHHIYWNLTGGPGGGALGHRLTIPADHYTPVDAELVPTGEIRSVAGTPFDFRIARVIGDRIRDAREPQLRLARGYDQNFVVAMARSPQPHRSARLEDPASGRVLEVWSDQPGLQLYTSNFFDGAIPGKRGELYRQGDAVALEPQMFPDTVNKPDFGSIQLRPGDRYAARIEYRFSTKRTK